MLDVGRHRGLPAVAEVLSPEEAEGEILDYTCRNPRLVLNLLRWIGYQADGTEETYRALARVMKVVALCVIDKHLQG